MIRRLADFNLTPRQAKVYLEVVRFESISVANIAKATKIAPQDIYKMLKKLENMGLITKTSDSPAIIKVVPLKKALNKLASFERSKTEEKMKRIDATIADLMKVAKHREMQDSIINIEVINPGTAFDNRIDLVFERAKAHDGYTPESIFQTWNHKPFHVFFPIFLKRGGKMREIVEVSNDSSNVRQILQKVNLQGDIEVKCVKRSSNMYFAVVDKKEAWIPTQKADRTTTSIIATTEPGIVRILRETFETAWNSPDTVTVYHRNATHRTKNDETCEIKSA